MKAWFTATCVLIGLAALFDNSTAGNTDLTQEEIEALMKLIRIFFDEKLKIDVLNVANIDWKNADWNLNQERAKAKYSMIVSGQFGVDGSGLKKIRITDIEYAAIFLIICPEGPNYDADAIVNTLKNLSEKQVVMLGALLISIFGGTNGELDMAEYIVLVKITLGIPELPQNTTYSMSEILDALDKDDGQVSLEEMKKVTSTKQLATFMLGDFDNFPPVENAKDN